MPQLHPSFLLNGQRYTKKGLLAHCDEVLQNPDSPDWHKEIADFAIKWFDTTRHIVVQTSGSTGKPKEIKLLKKHMINSARTTGSFFGLQSGDRALLCLPAQYIAGKMMVVRAFVLGFELTIVEPTANPLEKLDGTFNFAAMIPFQAENSFSKLKNIEKLIIGGGKVSDDQLKLLSKIEETQVYETYGMTETCTHVAVKPIRSNYFCALPGVVIDSNEQNCLVIDAPDISSSIIVTNDVVELVDNIRFELLGRLDNIINSGGIKVIPEKIEREIHPLILNRFFIAGLPDDKLGQKVVVIIEGKLDADVESLLASIKKRVKKNHHPKELYTVGCFKETPTGKIIRDIALYNLL